MNKSICTAIAATLLLGTSAHADSISTFKSLCLANAGNPAAIKKAGQKTGFKMTALGKSSFMGSKTKTDESLQINAFTSHKFECVVTTSDMANPKTVSAAFFKEIGLKPKRGKAKGKIGGRSYTFMHDTKGGEAFVMFAN